ncbi:MAG: hypothetical protein ACR2LQ_08475 [Acidimicrobiales bacterium]
MAQNQLLKRYLDAGMQFTAMTQQRAEAIVRDLVKAGEVQAEAAQSAVTEIVDRSRANTERLLDQVRGEVQKQVAVAEFVTKDVVNRLQTQIDDLRAQLPGARAAKRGVAKTSSTVKGTARKTTAKAATAKKAATKNVAAKKTAAKKKAVAKRATAKRATKKVAAKASSARKSVANKAPAKKSTASRS